MKPVESCCAANFMPRFKSMIFCQNSSKIKLFLQKNTKFLSAGAPPPDPVHPAAGGFAPRPLKQPAPLRIFGYTPVDTPFRRCLGRDM